MAASGSLIVKMALDAAAFSRGIGEVNKKLDAFGKTAATAMKGFAMIGGAAGVISLFKSIINEAAEAQDATNKLKFALENVGYSFSDVSGSVERFAKSIQDTTRYSDELAKTGLQRMLLYTSDLINAQNALKLAMDISGRAGIDLDSSITLVGQAMAGNVERLGRYLPQLKNLDDVLGKGATAAQKAEYALKILQDKFSGGAINDLKTYAGKVEQFKNAWSDFKEEIGLKVIPVMERLLLILTDIIRNTTNPPPSAAKSAAEFWDQRLQKTGGGLLGKAMGYQPNIPYPSEARFIGMGGGVVTNKIKPEITNILPKENKEYERWLKDINKELNDLAIKLKSASEEGARWGDELADGLKPGEMMMNGVVYDINQYIKLLEQLGGMTLSPDEFFGGTTTNELEDYRDWFKKINAELAELVLQGKLLEEVDWNLFGDYQTFGGLKAGEMMINGKKMTVDEYLKSQEKTGIAGGAEAWMAKYGDMEKNLMSSTESFLNSMTGSFQDFFNNILSGQMSFSDAMKQLWMNLASSVLAEITKMLAQKATSGIVSGISGLFKLQHGGIITHPTPAIVGEAGPEAVIPLKDAKVSGGQSSQPVVNYFHINAVDAPSFVELCRRQPAGFLSAFQKDMRGRGVTRSSSRSYL